MIYTPTLFALLLTGCRLTEPKDSPRADDSVSGETASPSDPEIDADSDGTPSSEDCDDDNAAINPSATEVCDGVDNDCDGLIDADDPSVTGAITVYLDSDGDGYGDPDTAATVCEAGASQVTDGNDYDDADALVWFAPDTYVGDVDDRNVANFCTGYGERRIDGDLDLSYATQADVDALGRLIEVTGGATIGSNDELANVDGLVSLTSIGGDLGFENTHALTRLDGLASLTSIGGGLELSGNATLANLDGLASLTSLGGALAIYDTLRCARAT